MLLTDIIVTTSQGHTYTVEPEKWSEFVTNSNIGETTDINENYQLIHTMVSCINDWCKIEELKPTEVIVDEMTPKEIIVGTTKPYEIIVDEMKPKEVTITEMKPTEVTITEMKPTEVLVDEIKPKEVVVDEIKPEEVLVDEIKPKEVVVDEMKPKEVIVDEIIPKDEVEIDDIYRSTSPFHRHSNIKSRRYYCDGEDCDNEDANWGSTIRVNEEGDEDKFRILHFCCIECAQTRGEDLYYK